MPQGSIVKGLLFSCLFVLSLPALGALTAEQQQTLEQARSYLKQVRSNLDLALSSAGTGDGPITGSRGKLTETRLAQAEAYVPLTTESLGKLPADDADVKAVQGDFDTANTQIASLRARLAGKAAPPSAKPATPSTPAAPSGGGGGSGGMVKLRYPQDDQLKSAVFNLREVEGNAEALAQLMAELKPIEDPDTIDHRKANAAMNTLANARRKAGFTADGLKGLPDNGEGVADAHQRLAVANASLAETEAFFTPLHARLQKLIDPATYPTLDADLKKLSEMSAMFAQPMLLDTDPLQAAELVKQKDAAMEEATRIAQQYALLMNQGTELSKRVEGQGNGFLQNHNAFFERAEQKKAALPEEVRKHLADAQKLADDAVVKQNAMFFTGGIPQHMGYADEKMTLYIALAPEESPTLASEVETAKEKLAEQEKSLEQLIIQNTQVPQNRYSGGDKEKLAEIAIDGWRHQQPDAQVLGVYFPVENWARQTRWEWFDGSWYFVDASRLQVQLLIAHDDTLAINRPINLKMDHQKGDQVIAIPLDSIDDDLIPQRYVMRSKIK